MTSKKLGTPQIVPPKPWRSIGIMMAGGLRSIGFDRDSELLLVISASGKSVVDCVTGTKLARDPADEIEDVVFLEAPGIGPLAGKTLRMSGLHGGGLPLATRDCWSLDFDGLWPTSFVLVEPGEFIPGKLKRQPIRHKLDDAEDVRACGFSYTGKSLVIATPADIAIYSRDAG